MPVSAWSATVSARTLDASTDLLVDDATQTQSATSPTLRAKSDWSGPATATTLSGVVVLVADDPVQPHTADGAGADLAVLGFGQGGFGVVPFGGGGSTGGTGIRITVVTTPVIPPVVVGPTAPDPAPAVWSWVIGSWRTGPSNLLSKATNRRATWRLVGRSEASFDLDGSDENAAAVEELVSDLWLLRSPVPTTTACVFRGRVGRTDHKIDAGGHTVSVTVGDYRAVLDRRQLWEGAQLSWLNTDQSGIAWGLVQHTQGQPGGSLGIVRGAGQATGIVRVRNDYPAGKRVGEALDQLSQVQDGFDWDITPAADPRDPTLRLDVFYPTRGTDRQTVLALGDRVAAVGRSVDPGDYANAERGTGAEQTGAGAALTPVRREAADITTRPEGRWDGSMSDPDLLVQQTIVERTVRELAERQVITPAWTVTLKPNSWGGPEDVWLGDPVVLVVKSGPLNVVATYRVLEIAAGWDDEDNLSAVLTVGAVVRPAPRWSLRRVDQRLQNLERR